MRETTYSFQYFLNSLDVNRNPAGDSITKVAAFKLCSSINNFLEYLYIDKKKEIDIEYGIKKLGKFKEELFAQGFSRNNKNISGEFLKLICDIANAYKHKSINRNKPLVSDSDQVGECLLIIQNRDHNGAYYAIDKGIQVSDNLKRIHNLEIVLRLGFEIISSLALKYSIVSSVPDPGNFRKVNYNREEAEKTLRNNSKYVAIASVDNNIAFLTQVYDPSAVYSIRNARKGDNISFSFSMVVDNKANPHMDIV